MPYEVSFTKRVTVVDRELCGRAIPRPNEPGGLGWFIWFRKGGVRLAIDIFTDDPDEGAFRVHRTSRTKRLLVLDTVVDTPELEELRALVAAELVGWVGGAVRVTRLDRNYSEKESRSEA